MVRATIIVFLGCVTTAAAEPSVIAYTDPESKITLRVSADGHGISAFGPDRKLLWHRAGYPEPWLILPDVKRPKEKPGLAWITRFRPFDDGEKGLTMAHRQGLNGHVLVVDMSCGSCGSAEAWISEEDGKLINMGFN